MIDRKNTLNIGIMIHPLSIRDFFYHFNVFYSPLSCIVSPILKMMPSYYIKESCLLIPSHKFLETAAIEINGHSLKLFGIMCPFFPEQMVLMKTKAKMRIEKGLKLAKKHNIKIVTLAAFTSIVTDGGKEVLNNDVNVTSGNALTAALCIEGIENAVKLFGKKLSECEIAIIGATGDIGSSCANYFLNKTKRLVLCARRIDDAHPLVEKLKNNIKEKIYVEKVASIAVKNADIALIVTSSPNELLVLDNFKKNAIVCDASMPANVSADAASRRKDVFIFEGGKAKLKFFEKIEDKKWKQLFPNNSVYGCLAESIVLGLEGKFENYSIGKGNITLSMINEIKSLAYKNGVVLSDYFWKGKRYSKSDLIRV